MSRSVVATALLLASPLAVSHPQAHHAAESGLIDGLLHVMTGADHLLAMLALGLWGASLARKHQTSINFGLPVVLAMGLALGLVANIAMAAEWGIVMSLIWLGALVAVNRSSSAELLSILLPASAVFILAHGVAHAGGTAAASTTMLLTYGAGMLIASCAVQQIGLLAGKKLVHHFPGLIKTAGALVSLSGLALLGTRLVAG